MTSDRASAAETAAGVNDDQVEYWNGEAGDKWVRHQESQDRMLAPLGALSLAAAAFEAGDRTIDVGCGCGETSLEIARRVGPSGDVLGIDISEQMLARARQRAEREPQLPLRFLRADAAAYPFPAGGTDAVHSRFGIMFFNNPAEAFANLARALRPGGRLAFICWRPLRENEWVRAPMEVAAKMAELPPMPAPGTPGPFAFGDKDYVARLLAAGGFREVEIVPHDRPVLLGETLSEGLVKILENSPVSRTLVDVDQTQRDRISAAVGEAVEGYMTPEGLEMGSATWVVTARTPG